MAKKKKAGPKQPPRIAPLGKREHPGQPSKLTPEVKATLLNEIRLGSSWADAARVAELAPETVIKWRHRGERETEGEYFQFVQDLERARVDRRRYYRAKARDIADKKQDIRAIQWLASVTEPEEFSPKVHVVIEQEFSAAIERLKVEFADEPELLERALSALAGEDGRRRAGRTEEGAGAAFNAEGLEPGAAQAISAAIGVSEPDV